MMLKNYVIFSVICVCYVLADVGTDYNEVNSDGSFSFGYSNDDIGGHYHTAAGSPNKIIRGRYGSRSPASGRVEETVYTAGPRGFRARGPAIHRHMDLSQYPRGPIGSPDDPLADPYDDPSYDFNFRTLEHERKEEADSTGRVRGLYSYLDDIGERHTVRYAAGAGTGFEVLNSVPDTPAIVAYNAPLYKAPARTRGRMSTQRGPDGQYKFILSGPDQRRSETSGPDGIVRGSYSYLDDKGIQRTVQYIAGPGIGYRIVKNIIGPGTHVSAGSAYGIRDFPTNDLSDDGYLRTAESGRIFPTDSSLGNLDGDKNTSPLGPGRRPLDGDLERSRGPEGKRPTESSSRRTDTSRRRNRPNSGEDKGFKGFDSSIGSRKDASSPERSGPEQTAGGTNAASGSDRNRETSSSSPLDGKDDLAGVRNRSRGKNDFNSVDRSDGGYATGYNYGKGVSGTKRPDYSSRDDDDNFFGRRPELPLSRNDDFDGSRTRDKSRFGDRRPRPESRDDTISPNRGRLPGDRRTGGSRINNVEDDYGSDFPLVTSDRRRLEIDRDREWSARGRDSTLIKNVGKWYVGLPPGSAVRAHVQNIDLLPLGGRAVAPSEALLRDELTAT